MEAPVPAIPFRAEVPATAGVRARS
jgi:hypothetical protein